MELKNCDHDMIKRMFKIFYDPSIKIDNLISNIPQDTISPAKVVEIFRTYPTNGVAALKALIN